MTDDQLMRNFKDSGSQDAWAELFKRNQALAYNYVRKACGQEYAGIVDEVVSEVFIQIERDRHQYDDSVTGFYPWFYRTMLTTTRDMMRAEKRARRFSYSQQAAEAASDLPGPDAKLEAQEDGTLYREQAAQLPALIDSLSPALRDAMRLTYVDRLSITQAAEKAGCNYDTMRKRVANAVETLRHRVTA